MTAALNETGIISFCRFPSALFLVRFLSLHLLPLPFLCHLADSIVGHDSVDSWCFYVLFRLLYRNRCQKPREATTMSGLEIIKSCLGRPHPFSERGASV